MRVSSFCRSQAFRLDEDVDISAIAGGYAVGWTRFSEYLRYTVDVTTAGVLSNYASR